MASYQKRVGKTGRVSWKARVRAKGYPTQTATFKTKTDAKRWATKIEAAISDGKFFPSKKFDQRTLSEAIDRYMEDHVSRLADKTDRKRHLEWWRGHIGEVALLQLCNDLDLIHDARRVLANEITRGQKKRSPTTVKRYLAALSKLFSCAMDWGWCETNPIRRIEKPKEPEGRMRFLADDERKSLLEQTAKSKDPYLHCIVILALSTGGRAGEVQGLKWSDVSLKRKTVTFRKTKNRQSRTVPITDTVIQELRALRKVRRIDSDLVFPRYDGKQPKSFRAAWDRAVRDAEIEDFRFHDLRHTAASYLAMSGASAVELKAILGHKTLAMVARYAHVSDQHTASIVNRMAEKFLS